MMYIGATAGKFRDRYDLHNSLLRRHRHSKKIQLDYDKYGFDAFEFFVIRPCIDNIQEYEKFYINKYNSIENGYNTKPGGDGGLVFTQETRKLISQKNKKSMKGKHLSEYQLNALKEANTGIKRSAEQKEFLSRRFSGENSNFSILKEKQVIDIKNRLVNGESVDVLANEYGVKPTTIVNIQRNRRWKYVIVDGLNEYVNGLPTIHTITEEQEAEIVEKLKHGVVKNKIHKEYHVSYDKIRNIIKKYNL